MADQITTFFWVLVCRKMQAGSGTMGVTNALHSSSAARVPTIGVVHRDIETTLSLDVDAVATLYPPAALPAWVREGSKDLYLQYSPAFGAETDAQGWIKTNFDPARHEFAECCYGKVASSGLSA